MPPHDDSPLLLIRQWRTAGPGLVADDHFADIGSAIWNVEIEPFAAGSSDGGGGGGGGEISRGVRVVVFIKV